MKEKDKDIKQLSKPLNSNVDHLEIMALMYNKYLETGNKLSNLMRYYLNGLDEIPTNKVKHLWNKKVFKKKRKLFINSFPEMLEILQTDYQSFKFNFRIIESKRLNSRRFMEYPIWSEYYDYYEINEIKSWGFNEKMVIEELKSKQINNSHPFYTVPISAFPIDRMRYFTRSEFITKNGYKLDGAIMNEGNLVILLFLEEEIEILNSNRLLRSRMNESLKKVADYYELAIEELNELKFETVIPIEKQSRINGIWKINNETEPAL